MTLSQIVFHIFITLQITSEVFSQFLNSNPSLGRDPSLPSPTPPSPPSLDLITAMSSQYNKLLQILPDNFYAFNQKYSLVQCAMCFQMATQYEVTQCLLCGQMLCMHRCGQATDSPSNLTDHARTSHGGSSLFVSNNCASVVIVPILFLSIDPPAQRLRDRQSLRGPVRSGVLAKGRETTGLGRVPAGPGHTPAPFQRSPAQPAGTGDYL